MPSNSYTLSTTAFHIELNLKKYDINLLLRIVCSLGINKRISRNKLEIKEPARLYRLSHHSNDKPNIYLNIKKTISSVNEGNWWPQKVWNWKNSPLCWLPSNAPRSRRKQQFDPSCLQTERPCVQCRYRSACMETNIFLSHKHFLSSPFAQSNLQKFEMILSNS